MPEAGRLPVAPFGSGPVNEQPSLRCGARPLDGLPDSPFQRVRGRQGALMSSSVTFPGSTFAFFATK